MLPSNQAQLARLSLHGLSIGDAFGESFFGERALVLQHITEQTIPDSSWEFTDDTVMGAVLCQHLLKQGGNMDANQLAMEWAAAHALDPQRGYGATARRLLRDIEAGADWRQSATAVFDGMGSMGNGAAMRVGPLGAYHWDDLKRVQELAAQSAVITHAHAEGTAGAIAVAIAAAYSVQIGQGTLTCSPNEYLEQVARWLPDTDTRSKVLKGKTLSAKTHPETLAAVLGNGICMTAQDTVPVALWCAAHYAYDFEQALWRAVGVLGDRDTIGAIVGSLVVLSAPTVTIPNAWQTKVEQVEESAFWQKP